MSKDCVLCKEINEYKPDYFMPLRTDHFVVRWEVNPVTPGHVLILPTRHIQYFNELNEAEAASLIGFVQQVKAELRRTDLRKVYQRPLLEGPKGTDNKYIDRAVALLERMQNRPPEDFNDGLNDGPAAGQTIPHLHWHVMPRWTGDTHNPRGGIRHMFEGLGNYEQGIL